jgi:hypothetical protein
MDNLNNIYKYLPTTTTTTTATNSTISAVSTRQSTNGANKLVSNTKKNLLIKCSN